jgi:hypothetical protein
MRFFWMGIGLLAVSVTVVVPYVASGRCKDRWASFNLEGVWDYKSGRSVKIGGGLFREEYVSFDPRAAKPLDPNAKDQTLAHPNWVVLGPDNHPAIEGAVRIPTH